MRAAALLVLAIGSLADARPRPARVITGAEPAIAPEKPASALVPPEQLIERAERLFATLDYDQALPIARRLVSDLSIDVDIRVRALALEGSTLAITADVAEAERPFRKLLRLKPDFELPPKSPPKILAAFRKVQTEERLLADELEVSRRKQLVSRLKLLDELPPSGRGGKPLKFSLRVFDPDGAVSGVTLPYRRVGESSFSVLALGRDETGAWSGVLAGEATASPEPYILELYVTTTDAKGGVLLTRGSKEAPIKLEVTSGSVRRVAVPRPIFFTAAALTAASGVAALVLGLQLRQTQADWYKVAQPDDEIPRDLPNPLRLALESRGNTLALATTAALITMGALAVTTVILGLLVDWFD